MAVLFDSSQNQHQLNVDQLQIQLSVYNFSLDMLFKTTKLTLLTLYWLYFDAFKQLEPHEIFLDTPCAHNLSIFTDYLNSTTLKDFWSFGKTLLYRATRGWGYISVRCTIDLKKLQSLMLFEFSSFSQKK